MNPANRDDFTVGAVDRTKWFIPEHLTPLAHIPAYASLSSEIRLRYNHLFASCYHEHFICLERMLANHTLPVSIDRFAATAPDLTAQLGQFRDEERKHTAWFHALHQACEPEFYRDNYHHFVCVAPLFQRIFDFCARRPWRFPFCLWLAMIIEERTITASREIFQQPDVFESHFVNVHRLHAADEAGHVSLDGVLLRRLWPALGPVGRTVNRCLFVWVLREFFRLPKRAAWRVIERLADEFPDLRPRLPELRAQIRALDDRSSYLAGIYSRAREPRTFALADRFRELRRLEQELLPEPTPAAI
jgi:hypothetical protein